MAPEQVCRETLNVSLVTPGFALSIAEAEFVAAYCVVQKVICACQHLQKLDFSSQIRQLFPNTIPRTSSGLVVLLVALIVQSTLIS